MDALLRNTLTWFYQVLRIIISKGMKGEIKMTKFVEIIIWKHGYDEQVIINVDDISRLSEGPNILTLKTPLQMGVLIEVYPLKLLIN